jgi:hypothetical protein
MFTTLLQGVHFSGLLDVLNILSADTCISRQTEGHQFGDHPSSQSVRVTSPSATEAHIVICCVFMAHVSQCSISLRAEHAV